MEMYFGFFCMLAYSVFSSDLHVKKQPPVAIFDRLINYLFHSRNKQAQDLGSVLSNDLEAISNPRLDER